MKGIYREFYIGWPDGETETLLTLADLNGKDPIESGAIKVIDYRAFEDLEKKIINEDWEHEREILEFKKKQEKLQKKYEEMHDRHTRINYALVQDCERLEKLNKELKEQTKDDVKPGEYSKDVAEYKRLKGEGNE